jgi:pimeloyl-ACP methyl ester carboxylesterase
VKLELVHYAETADNSGQPLLLVHGAYHGAWCWEYWIKWFGERGRSVTALSLRGHGKSDGREALHDFGLQDYLEDVIATARDIAAESYGQRPILVGHSMGGAIAQLAIAECPAFFSGAVLLASLPPDSIRLRELLPLLLDFRSRRTTKKLMASQVVQPEEVLALDFFDGRISREQAVRYARLLQPESSRALREMMSFRAPQAPASLPILVLGSSRDALFGRSALVRTARHFGADLRILEEGCHDAMLDHIWQQYATALDTWLLVNQL